MSGIYEDRRTVLDSEIDEIGVASNVTCIRWMISRLVAGKRLEVLVDEIEELRVLVDSKDINAPFFIKPRGAIFQYSSTETNSAA